MKNILLAIALIFVMALGVNAQGGKTDGFFKNYSDNDYTDRTVYNNFILPNAHGTSSDYDSAPLGGGLLILTTIGTVYAITRKRNK